MPTAWEQQRGVENEAKKSTGTEKRQGEALGPSTGWEERLALRVRRTFPALWFLVCRGNGASQQPLEEAAPHQRWLSPQPGISPPTSQTGKEKRDKKIALSPEFWRAASARKKKKKRLRASLVTATDTI